MSRQILEADATLSSSHEDRAHSEAERLAVLDRYGVMDTPREGEFDEIVRLASMLVGTPIALVSFVADTRQWFKAEVGFGGDGTALDVSVCAHAIREPGLFVVPDLSADPRFKSNALVTAENGIRFYAGAPLVTPDGFALGTLCVIDRKVRPAGLTADQAAILGALARQVMAQLDLRRAIAERDQALGTADANARRYKLLADATRDAIWDWDLGRDHVQWNEALHEAHGYKLDEIEPTGGWWEERVHPDDRERISGSIHAAIDGDAMRWAAEYRFRQADGSYADIFDRGSLIRDERGRAVRMIGAMLDLTERNRAQTRRSAMAELGERLRDVDDRPNIVRVAAEIIGRTLDVDRAGYGAVDAEAETVLIDNDWTLPGAASYPGARRFRDHGSYIDDLKRGETVVIVDVERDSRTAGHIEALRSLDVLALVNLPVIEHGRLVGIFYLNQRRARLWSPGELAFLRNVVDQTRAAVERARSIAALRASEELFRVFAQAMPNQVWAANAAGTIDWLNQQVDEYFGAPEDRGAERGWAEFVHPDDLPGALQAWQHSIVRGDIYETEFRLQRRDGVFRWFLSRALPIRNDQGEIVRWIGTNTDVDEQKAIAAELAQVNHLLASRVEERTRERDRLWSTTNDLMATAGFDGYLKAVNPAWTRMLGYDEAELLGQPLLDFVVEDDHEELRRVVGSLQRREPIESFTTQLQTKDGAHKAVMWSAVPDRGVVYVVGRDITDQREIEDKLRQSQKMEAVGQLTGGIAHDFNNLLTGIIGSLDLLQTRIRQGRTENLDRYLKAATTSANRAASLTHRLLAFARRQPLDPRPVDTNALVTSLEDLLRRTIGEAIGLTIEAEPGTWATLCDPNQLESAIINLAINARDAMPDGGGLTIATGNVVLDSHAIAAFRADVDPGSYVRISVQDTGEGMASDVIKRAFEPFFTTKPIGQGTGLGLSMVYGFARQSDGLARIESEPGRGTSVSIYLPRHSADVLPAETGLAPAVAAGPSRDETVLVVEDELVVRDLVVEMLTEMGLRSLQAVDGPSGLRILTSDTRIDLVVSDVGLPGLNGRQMADQARRVRPDLPVLFITGYAENAALSGFLDPGMEMIPKPFKIETLAARVRAMLDGREVTQA